MGTESIGIFAVIITLVLMFLGIPVAISMAVPAIIGILYLRNFSVLCTVIDSVTWDHCVSYTLTVIPLFVLMGDLLFVSDISDDLFDVVKRWLGKMKGGLALATIGSAALFSACCGSSLATTGTIGVIAAPQMEKVGYDKRLSAGAIVAGGTLGILIPPSSMMILYGTIAEQSIGKLLIAGIIPGIILTVLYMFTIILWTRINPSLCEKLDITSTWRMKIVSLLKIMPVATIFLVVIGGIYFGLFSATEAAAIGVTSTFVIALLMKRMTKSRFMRAINSTLKTTGFLFAIIISAFLLNYLLVFTRVPSLLADFLSASSWPRIYIFAGIIMMYLILGAIMDAFAMVVVTVPIILPTIEKLGYDLVWFGVIIVLVVELAFITPPVGINCFVLKGTVSDYTLETIFAGAGRFIVAILITVILLYAYPNLALLLPNTMG